MGERRTEHYATPEVQIGSAPARQQSALHIIRSRCVVGTGDRLVLMGWSVP